ncbi:MAG: LuxR C-terminal-related transcriptional regulator, partial [Dehalococcoidia bacterium]|nr:LuxR C-terminal-related transcriptional regulator [Dehalococcoidia bacterium]
HLALYSTLSRRGDVAGMTRTAAELLSVAKQIASPRAEAEANLAAAISGLWQGDITYSRERALYALNVGERAQELAICCRANRWLVIVGMYLGDHQFMRYYAERGLAVARRLGTPNLEVALRLRLAHANFMAGAWTESLEQGLECLDLARRVGNPRDLACSLTEQAIMLVLRGDLPEAESCIAEARMVFGVEAPADRGVFGLIDVAETALALERGQAEEALAIAKGFNHPSAFPMAPDILPPPNWPMGLMLLAEAQVASGEAEDALETARKISILGASDARYLIALGLRAEGLARQALNQPEAAQECLSGALQIFAALRMPFESARTLLDKAILVFQGGAGQQKVAARDAQQCLDTFERLGARRYAERVRRLLGDFGVPSAPARRHRLGGVFLSGRELEIARLAAAGLTTAEIAGRLTISQRTVTTHLHHIYSRLGIGSRTALARQVIEAGLL